MKTTAVSLLALLAAMPLQAQDIALDEIVVSANIAPIDASRTGASVETLSAEDLKQSGAMPLGRALATLPTLSYSDTGPIGSSASLRLRGLSGAYIKVLVDGIDVSDPAQTQSQFDFGTLGTADVSRVEVLGGSQSAQYGSTAVAGVISVTTKRPEQEGISQSVALEAGSYETLSGSYTLSSRGDRHEVSVTASSVHSEGFSAGDDSAGNREDDGFDSERLSFSASYDVTDVLSVGASGFYQHADSQIDECCEVDGDFHDGVTPDDDHSLLHTRGGRIFATLSGDQLTQTLSIYRFENERTTEGTERNFFGPDPSPYEWSYDGTRTVMDYRASYLPTDRLTLGFGATHAREDLFSATSDQWTLPGTDSGEREIDGLFGEATLALTPALDVTLAARHDDYSDFGGHTTARLAAAWRLDDTLLLRASAGSGFVAPSLYQLYSTQYGNEDLGPERSRSVDLGLEKTFGNGAEVKATLFHQQVEDLIKFVTLTTFPAYTGEYQTADGTSRSSGIALSGSVPLNDRLQLSGVVTYTHTSDPDGEALPRVPETDLRLGLDADLTDRLDAGIALHAVRNLYDERANSLIAMPDYETVEATVEFDLGQDAQVYLRADNLLDEDYQVVKGFGTSGRAFYVGLRKSF
ncbi:TonB-dependent receptor plug domain-containing protein [Cereibacter sphaeroides]|uniref:TonB-dependent receptor plug domain-containing protein n=1 Tax=Cereibacter sphaeroides TaxID=1063 RepID=UPI001F2923F6|nr:TonB-dependent receptor [Cereibacter sphaeroides]MCE6970452.1 TonB-dependent receptor [Cereibacter sphaeroides]